MMGRRTEAGKMSTQALRLQSLLFLSLLNLHRLCTSAPSLTLPPHSTPPKSVFLAQTLPGLRCTSTLLTNPVHREKPGGPPAGCATRPLSCSLENAGRGAKMRTSAHGRGQWSRREKERDDRREEISVSAIW